MFGRNFGSTEALQVNVVAEVLGSEDTLDWLQSGVADASAFPKPTCNCRDTSRLRRPRRQTAGSSRRPASFPWRESVTCDPDDETAGDIPSPEPLSTPTPLPPAANPLSPVFWAMMHGLRGGGSLPDAGVDAAAAPSPAPTSHGGRRVGSGRRVVGWPRGAWWGAWGAA